jgi:hypothetical protein
LASRIVFALGNGFDAALLGGKGADAGTSK